MGEATAFEICPLEPIRKLQIDFNDTQVIASNGLLAKISGSERLISVGCGHTAAFIKAAMAGCRTDQLAIQKGDGTIDCDYLCKKGFGPPMKDGIRWRVFPWQVEAEVAIFGARCIERVEHNDYRRR